MTIKKKTITYTVNVNFYCAFGQYNHGCIKFFFHTDKPVFLNFMEGDPVDLYVFQSDSVNLSCQNSAEPAANMTWSFNGKFFINPADNYVVRIMLHYPYNSLLPRTCCTVCDGKTVIPRHHVVSRVYTRKCVRHVVSVVFLSEMRIV